MLPSNTEMVIVVTPDWPATGLIVADALVPVTAKVTPLTPLTSKVFELV